MALGLDSREVARQIGVSHQQLLKYERGLSRLTSGSLSKISSLLGVPLPLLFGGAGLHGAPDSEGSKEVLALRAFASTEEGQELNHAFHRIGECNIRRLYLALVRAVAGI